MVLIVDYLFTEIIGTNVCAYIGGTSAAGIVHIYLHKI